MEILGRYGVGGTLQNNLVYEFSKSNPGLGNE